MPRVIEISGLTKRYGSFVAVDQLDLSIDEGEIFGLLGPNGAGKSTTILMLMGLTEPDEGKVLVCGIDPVTRPVEVKKIVGYLPEDVGFYDNITGLENLAYTAGLNGMPRKEAMEKSRQMLVKVGLGNEMDKKAGKYSRGMRQRLGLADVLIKQPRIIILDEPTLGIDPAGIREFLDLIIHLSKKEGITVIFSSHHLHQVQQVCDRVGIFVKGRLLAEGNINSLAEQLFSKTAYTVEAGISKYPVDKSPSREKVSVKKLAGELRKLQGVVNVTDTDHLLQIECTSDITPEIARTIVQAGAGLNYLRKREYGLNEIYYRYFEGGDTDE